MSQNPKDIAGSKKVPMHLLPSVGPIAGAMACRQGAIEYGPYNWREQPIELSGYLGAVQRHLDAVKDGQDKDPKSLGHHLGHIIATASIILDAEACGTLKDDRIPAPYDRCPAFEAQMQAEKVIEELAAAVQDGHQGQLARMGMSHAEQPVQRLVPRPVSMQDDPVAIPFITGEGS